MTATAAFSPDEADRFRSVMRRRLGLYFDDGKLGFLAEVLNRRIGATGHPSSRYLTDLEMGARAPEELHALVRELTVAETYFFRNVEQFHALREIALPERARAGAANRPLRILSAACASGEEPYTLAIVAREHPALVGRVVSIRGVDINPVMLQRAVAGRYSTWALRETPEDLRARYFRVEGRELVLDADIRSAVSFEERNLAEPEPALWQPEAFDIIFCRNILMYFAPEAARALIDRITLSLVPGGYLFLGSAETLRGLSQSFHLCHTHGTFYYRRSDRAERDTRLAALPPAELHSVVASISDTWVETNHRASERIRELTAPTREKEAGTPTVDRIRPGITAPRPATGLGRAVELIRQERFVEAQSALALLPTASARDPDVLLLQAVLLTHGGDLVAAEELCRAVLSLDEMSAGAHYLLALCREKAGDGRGAADHDQAAAYLDPGFAMPHLHLGLLARRTGQPDAARRELSEALSLLEREDSSRLLMFGGGFGRDSLISLCRAELLACGGSP